MDNPRGEKVAVVTEVRERLGDADASVVTEYRGLTVGDLAELRHNLAGAGGEYKVYKNTLVRLAIDRSEHAAMAEFLTGPTALTFVNGDVSAVAKALRDFSRAHPALVVKGGLLDGKVLSGGDLAALADLPSRDALLSRLAGGFAAPLRQLAALMEALPRNLAYGLSALADQRREGEPEAPTGESVAEPPAADTAEPPAADTADTADTTADTAEAPAADPAAEAPQPEPTD